jgi:hypothetical protein
MENIFLLVRLLWMCFVDYYAVWCSDRQWTFFSTYGQMDNIFVLVRLLWLCFVDYYAVWRFDKRVDVLFYIRSHRHYILVGVDVIAVFLLIIILCDVLIDSCRSFLLNVRWTTYFSYWHYHGCVFVIIILSDVLIDSGHSFLLKVRWTTYFT